MMKKNPTIEELASSSHAWSVRGIVLSIFIVGCTLISSEFNYRGVGASINNTSFISKHDLIIWGTHVLQQVGVGIDDTALLRQAYSLYLKNLDVTSAEIDLKIAQINSFHDYVRLVPSNAVDTANDIILNNLSVARWYENIQWILVAALVVCQLAALNASNQLNAAFLKLRIAEGSATVDA